MDHSKLSEAFGSCLAPLFLLVVLEILRHHWDLPSVDTWVLAVAVLGDNTVVPGAAEIVQDRILVLVVGISLVVADNLWPNGPVGCNRNILETGCFFLCLFPLGNLLLLLFDGSADNFLGLAFELVKVPGLHSPLVWPCLS